MRGGSFPQEVYKRRVLTYVRRISHRCHETGELFIESLPCTNFSPATETS